MTIATSETRKNDASEGSQRARRRRTSEEKYGKYKWIKTLIRRNSEELREIRRRLRMLSLGLKDFMRFEGELLVAMVAKDSRDVAILEELRAAGPYGRAPREIWENVRRSTGLKYHHVSRRIRRMNHTLEREIGEQVADKVGRNWALSSFMAQNWGAVQQTKSMSCKKVVCDQSI